MREIPILLLSEPDELGTPELETVQVFSFVSKVNTYAGVVLHNDPCATTGKLKEYCLTGPVA